MAGGLERRATPLEQYELRGHPEWNLPPGVTPDDIDRLFADPEPPDDATCGGCRHARWCRMLGGAEPALVCTCDPDDLTEVERAQAACDGWEER